MRKLRVVTFWAGEDYRVMAENMVLSAEKVGLETKVFVANDLGTWKKNTEQKSEYIRLAMEEFPGEDILWVDADSEFVRRPTEIVNLSAHYEAALYMERSTVWGCTMFLRNSDFSRRLLDRWDEQIKRTPRFSADSNLLYVLRKYPSTKIYPLPPSYVWHALHMRQRFPTADPVILQRMFVTFENKALRRAQVVNRKEEDWK